jgi:demethoxyubiquinone hydroxylase (CLK1/Coq7/Cat5 family)
MQAQLQAMMAMMQGGKAGENMAGMLAGGQSTSMDRQDKRKLINEIKDEMKIMIT